MANEFMRKGSERRVGEESGPDKQFVLSDLIYIDQKLFRVLDKKTDLTLKNVAEKKKTTERQESHQQKGSKQKGIQM